MKIPMFDLNRKLKRFETQIEQSINVVIKSGNLILGNEVNEFEKEFANYLGAKFCIGVGNGTDALEIALKSLQLDPGSCVLTVANAGGYATTSIINSGLSPRYIEIDYDTGNTSLQYFLQADLADVRAVVLTHLFGNPIEEIDEITAFLRAKGIKTIEDCAQAQGARYKSKAIGTFGDISCFSFYPTKNLGCLGDGGAVVTSTPELAQRIGMLRTYGWAQKYEVAIGFGRNSRLDEIQAAFLRKFLVELETDNLARKRIAKRYRDEISVSGLNILSIPQLGESAFHIFALTTVNREELVRHLVSQGVSTAIHYPIPDNLQLGFHYDAGKMNQTELFANNVVSIPIFPELQDEEVTYVIDAINCFPSDY